MPAVGKLEAAALALYAATVLLCTILVVGYRDVEFLGALVALTSNDVMTVPWASCLPEYFSLCSNMLLYWETIRAACLEGYGRFDFGRSTRDSGTYRFKRQWGALESPLYWYSISAAPRRDRPAGESAAAACLVGLWKRLPLAVTRRLGPHVRRYLIQ